MSSATKRLLVGFFLCVTQTIPVAAQPGNAIRIDQIVPTLTNDSLRISATFHNLFSRKIIGTIQSGLPSIINAEVRLMDNVKKEILHKLISRSISYDIWEEEYSLATEDTVETFRDFESVKRAGSRLTQFPLVMGSLLKFGTQYRVRIRVAIIPISAGQGAKVNEWLLDPNQTEEGFASDDRSSGFKFTLGNLLSFFVRDRRRSRYNSDWFSSQPFILDEIR
ncbi:DUF4390 domain-containing protein [bacterium]|nr:DUF4390 domain-containing protein [bacterium]